MPYAHRIHPQFNVFLCSDNNFTDSNIYLLGNLCSEIATLSLALSRSFLTQMIQHRG